MRIFGVTAGDGRTIKMAWSVMLLIVLALNLWTMRSWTERTGVYDDICYLRQAHLFQRFGFGGFNTDLSRDDDQYFATLAREIGYPDWADPARAFCHPLVGGKRVIQYPPGTGFRLSLFPEGFQRVPLYAASNLAVVAFGLLALWSAHSRLWIGVSGAVGVAALYFMVNPAKASFSIAPTMVVCAAAGLLTNVLVYAPKASQRIVAAGLIGFLLGVAVSLRISNLVLSAGYFLILLALTVWSRKRRDILRFVSFGAAYVVGLVPTLIANAINAGSVVATTYGPADTVPPDFSFRIAREYIADMQGSLIFMAAAWAIFASFVNIQRTVALIVLVNLVVNLFFFLTHPISTPYYLMPLVMLSLWTLLFSTEITHRLAAWRAPVI